MFSPNSIALLANYVIVVEDRPINVRKIFSVIDSPPALLAITNPPCTFCSVISALAELLVYLALLVVFQGK